MGVGGFVLCVPLYFYWQDLKQASRVKPWDGAVLAEEVLAIEQTADGDQPEVDMLTLDLVLEKHRQATGLLRTQSLLLSGVYIEDGRKFQMKLAVKMPMQIRKTLSDPHVEIACVFDGQDARVEVTQSEEKVTEVLDDVLYLNALILEGSLLSLGKHSGETKASYHQGKDQSHDGRNCWTIVSLIPGTPVMNHLIDPETGFERGRYLDLKVGDRSHQVSLHFSDFRPVGSFYFPHRYVLQVDGQTRGLATIESVKYYSGLMPWMF